MTEKQGFALVLWISGMAFQAACARGSSSGLLTEIGVSGWSGERSGPFEKTNPFFAGSLGKPFISLGWRSLRASSISALRSALRVAWLL